MRPHEIIRRAQQELQQLRITRPPVDVYRIAQHYDIEIRNTELPDDVSGVLRRDQSGRATIFVNKDHRPPRQRFSIAHELGHFFLHPNEGVHMDRKNYMFRDGESKKAVNPIEIQANLFASELLMPKPFIEEELGKLSDQDLIDTDEDIVQDLAKTFNVSVTAMSIKFQNIGFVF